ncbi:MAG: restriction endonuclease subunit S [Paludibacteraceae bacterium]|nr:restriction endonuclease subunit S [Paludibacteraceae bacterium]
MMKTFRFDEIAYNSTQKVKPTEADKEHYIGLEHIDGECLYISRWGSDVAPIGEKLVMRKGDILFGKRRAYQRKVAIAPIDGIFSAHGLVLRPKEDVVDKDYFPFFMSSNQFLDRAVQISVGGLSPTINWKDLARQEFTLPSLFEQKVLADKLWAAYRVKESYKKLLAATDDMLKAKFMEMFGEEDGKEVKLRDLIATNFAGEWGNDDILGNGTQVIKTNNFKNDGTISFDNIVTRNIQVDILERKRLNRGDILLERSGGTKDNPVGRVVYFNQEGEFVVNNFVQVLRANDLVASKYLFYNLFIYYHTHKIDIKRMGHQTSGIQNLKLQEFLDRKIVLPPLPLQQQFVEIATQAEATKESLRKSIENIDQVIKSLINQ